MRGEDPAFNDDDDVMFVGDAERDREGNAVGDVLLLFGDDAIVAARPECLLVGVPEGVAAGVPPSMGDPNIR